VTDRLAGLQVSEIRKATAVEKQNLGLGMSSWQQALQPDKHPDLAYHARLEEL
jgi:hypothetical protein